MTRDEFVNYFFASTTIIGILSRQGTEAAPSIDAARAGRSWEEAVGGCYYIKPNYPGRSSHVSRIAADNDMERLAADDQNCNAGFLVPPIQRGKKVGGALAESFLVYAPKLGYKSSVFNLVFKSE